MNSFIKWVGGKSSFVKNGGTQYFPTVYNTYFEPFLGAGNVLLKLQPKKAIISDINPELITAWRVVQCNAENLIDRLVDMQGKVSRDYYYKVRAQSVQDMSPLDIAARFIFLNKTTFNGLYRVNRKGQFNAPYGSTGRVDRQTGEPILPKIVDIDGMRKIAAYLNKATVTIECRSFEWIGKAAMKNDFVYLDPPYLDDPGEPKYTAYTPYGFSGDMHKTLIKICKKLAKKHVRIAMSNSMSDFALDFIPDNWSTHEVTTSRSVSRTSTRRGKKVELLATSY